MLLCLFLLVHLANLPFLLHCRRGKSGRAFLVSLTGSLIQRASYSWYRAVSLCFLLSSYRYNMDDEEQTSAVWYTTYNTANKAQRLVRECPVYLFSSFIDSPR